MPVAAADPPVLPAAARHGVDGDAPSPSARPAGWSWWLDVRASLVPFVVARLVVGAALAVARQLASGDHLSAAASARVHAGLLGWDAGWYESIAAHGYGGAGHDALRFFPLFPLLARGLAVLPGVSVGAAVVVVANVSALAGTALLVTLVRRETGDDELARRAVWLLSLAPPAFTFVMGYAEGTLLVLAVGTFLALRTRHFVLAAGLGVAAGLTRPLGALLLVPAAVEGLRHLAGTRPAERVGRAVAVLGPAAGTGAYLAYTGWRYGDAAAPLREQVEGAHHGHLTDPLVTLAHDASYLAHGHHLGEGLHLPWVVVVVALLVVTFRTWPASYGAFALAVVAVALTGSNLDSFERYALSAFPLVLAGARLTADERVLRVVLVLSGCALLGYALLAFTNLSVP